MNAKLGFAMALVLVTCSWAQGQVVQATSMPGGGNYPPFAPSTYSAYPWGYSGSSTAAEGFGRGLGDVIRSVGDYNLSTSEAAVNFSEARRRQIENNKLWVQTYFEMRDINRQAMVAELTKKRGNPEDWIRYAAAGKPRPLTNSELDAVTGKIRWPLLLTGAEYAIQRAALERIFADRAYHGMIGADGYKLAMQATDDMLASLRMQIRELPPDQFIEARKFLQSLVYEASQPAG